MREKLNTEKTQAKDKAVEQKHDPEILRSKITVPIGPMGGHKGNRTTIVEIVYLAGRNPI